MGDEGANALARAMKANETQQRQHRIKSVGGEADEGAPNTVET